MSFNISRTGTHEVKLPCLCGITCVTQVEVYERSYVEFLETENARLREALEILAAETSGICCECSDVKDIARAALENESVKKN
jgi:hypothetical protein